MVNVLHLVVNAHLEGCQSVSHGLLEYLLSVVCLLLVDEGDDALCAGVDDLHDFLLVLVDQLVHLAHVLLLLQVEQLLQ